MKIIITGKKITFFLSTDIEIKDKAIKEKEKQSIVDAVKKHIKYGFRCFVFDCNKLRNKPASFVINTFVECLRLVKKFDGRIILYNLRQEYRELLEIMQLDSLFTFDD